MEELRVRTVNAISAIPEDQIEVLGDYRW